VHTGQHDFIHDKEQTEIEKIEAKGAICATVLFRLGWIYVRQRVHDILEIRNGKQFSS
jgi:hypothetical protein